MMIDFEDKEPGPGLSLIDRALVALVLVGSAGGLASAIWTVVSWLS